MTSSATVSVIDYGVGNLGSVLNMFRRIDVDAALVSTPEEIRSAGRLLLPGVGAFDAGMAGLRAKGLEDPILERAASGVPVLGICLGMQMLTTASEEGSATGLGLIDARCVRFLPDPSIRIPHMGWSWVDPRGDHPMRPTAEPRQRYYFAHSYHARCDDDADVAAVASHGQTFSAVIVRDNVCGAQFHPEKSHHFGMAFLERFSGWAA